MPQMNIHFHMIGDPPLYPESDAANLIYSADPVDVIGLERGMRSGAASVMIRVTLPDGKIVIAETSAKLFITAARAIDAKFPDAFAYES